MIYLSKPGKAPNSPSGLRPISLLDPMGKVLMNCFGTKMRQQAQHLLNQFPQFAYLPGRSTNDAIRRVLSHCEQFRTCVNMLQHRIHRQALGVEQQLMGGLIMSLDLSRAFDTVPRQKLFSALQSVGITDDLVCLLRHVYDCTVCTFSYKGAQRSYRARKGIRQGCSGISNS